MEDFLMSSAEFPLVIQCEGPTWSLCWRVIKSSMFYLTVTPYSQLEENYCTQGQINTTDTNHVDLQFYSLFASFPVHFHTCAKCGQKNWWKVIHWLCPAGAICIQIHTMIQKPALFRTTKCWQGSILNLELNSWEMSSTKSARPCMYSVTFSVTKIPPGKTSKRWSTRQVIRKTI